VPAGQLAALAQEPVGNPKLSDESRYCIATQCARFTPCWLNERAPARAPESAYACRLRRSDIARPTSKTMVPRIVKAMSIAPTITTA
jgi:hypothetical protein